MTTASDPPSADLDRNDLDGALAWFRWHIERNLTPDPDTAHVLYMLQDDSTALKEAVRKLRGR